MSKHPLFHSVSISLMVIGFEGAIVALLCEILTIALATRLINQHHVLQSTNQQLQRMGCQCKAESSHTQ